MKAYRGDNSRVVISSSGAIICEFPVEGGENAAAEVSQTAGKMLKKLGYRVDGGTSERSTAEKTVTEETAEKKE